jgi:hypothetical protein
MKGQINIIYVGILTLISIAVFGTILIWNFSVSESTSNEFNEKQMEIIATQISEDINYLSTFDKNSVYTIKKDLPSTIGEDDYCIRLNQDESGNKRIYVSKKGNSLSYNSFKKTDFYIDFNNKELNFENSISCGGKTNIVKTQNSIELTTSLTSAAAIVDAPPTISTIIDTSTNEDTSKDINFTVSDENLASLALSAISGNTILVNQTANGGLIIPSASGSSRTLTINPNNNQNGIVEINITATDGSSQTDIESFNLTINSVDDGPTTPTVIYSPSSNRKVGDSLTCVASSTDPEGDSISYSYQFRNGSESGTIIQDFSSDNTIDSVSATYAHEAIYCIAYATSNSIDSSSSIATITISNTDPSSASLSSNTINEGASAGTLIGSITCSDVDNDVCSYTEYSPGYDGASVFEISGTSIILSSGQTLDYDTKSSYSYSVLVEDGYGGDIYEDFTIIVTNINQAPSDINPNSLNINENSPINSEVGTLTVTDSDSGDSHTFTELTGGTGESYFNISSSGVVEVEENSILNYESGTTSYTYEVRVTDSGSLTYNEIITINVLDVNEAPVTFEDSYSMDQDTTLNIIESEGVLANDTDPDSDTLTATLVNNVSSGSLSLASDGSFTYTPVIGFTGAVEFNYSAGDGGISSLPENVTITVNAVSNNAPVASVDSGSVNEDTTLSDTLTAADIDGDSLTFSIVSQPSNGVATITNSATGAFNYVPGANYNGVDSFTFKANDGTDDSNTATFSITINSVNDAPIWSPVIPDKTVGVSESTNIDLFTYHLDVDGSDLATSFSINSISPPSPDFTCSITSDQYLDCIWNSTPPVLPQLFDVTVNADDGNGGSATDTVAITVDPSAGGSCQPIPDPGLCDPPYDPEDYPEASHDGRSCYRSQDDCDNGISPIGSYLG